MCAFLYLHFLSILLGALERDTMKKTEIYEVQIDLSK